MYAVPFRLVDFKVCFRITFCSYRLNCLLVRVGTYLRPTRKHFPPFFKHKFLPDKALLVVCGVDLLLVLDDFSPRFPGDGNAIRLFCLDIVPVAVGFPLVFLTFTKLVKVSLLIHSYMDMFKGEYRIVHSYNFLTCLVTDDCVPHLKELHNPITKYLYASLTTSWESGDS